MQETQVCSLGWEDPLEKRMATHSNILAWEIPWTGEPGGATVHEIARVGDNLATKPTNQKKINSPTIIWAKDKINQFRGMSNPMSTCKSMFKHTCSKEGKLNFAIKWAKSKSNALSGYCWKRLRRDGALHHCLYHGRMAMKHVYCHMWNESPVQVQCMIEGARGWCTGITQRDGMGTVFRLGNTCTPVEDSCQCIAKPLQYCKVISLQLK